MFNLECIKGVAHEVGFDLCGVAKYRVFEEDKAFLGEWIEQGYASSLDYLKRNIDCRADANRLVEGAKSVVVCAVSYKNMVSDGYPADHQAKVASYACTTDYHTTIKQMLFELCERLKEVNPDFSARCFVDSAPIFEKRYAVEAGLGWIGRQSLLVTPDFGSFVLLGEIVMTAECDEYDKPYEGVGCGECRRCVEACPNGAIKERHIDTSRCISCATIECRADEGICDTHGWIFGCDECQIICPYNRKAPYFRNPKFTPLFNPIEKTPEREEFVTTPMVRRFR
ncbi:MAG: tRNA epoxyqueuosine(34) reductase QueG [Alistipes sp.]|nr:tRNA epoxyqueuosine(34) reductase QueG [Alistipes sp.]